MGRVASFIWEQERVGSSPCAPGHPVIIALMMIDRYDSMEHATREALHDSFIRGKGNDVANAIDLLRNLRDGKSYECIAQAERCWLKANSDRPSSLLTATCKQAIGLVEELMLAARTWNSQARGGFPYRVEDYQAHAVGQYNDELVART